MWYEILPTVGIMVGLMTVPHFAGWGMSKLFLKGKPTCRHWEAGNREDMYNYMRDRRITGSEYIPRGLESIPELK